MYCRNCGRIVDDDATYCKNCGANLNDSSSFGFAVLGFFIPLAGLILFLVYEGKKPKRAKSAGKGALIGFITNIVIGIINDTISLFDNIINESVSDMHIT